MCLILSDYDWDARCETVWCIARSSCWIQANFWQEVVQVVLQIHFHLIGLANPLSGKPVRHIHRKNKPVEPEQVPEKHSRTRYIQEIPRPDPPLFISFHYGDWWHNLSHEGKVHRGIRMGVWSFWGETVLGMEYVTAVVSVKEGIFSLNLVLKTKSALPKTVMQMGVIKRSIAAGLRFSAVVFDLWYFLPGLSDSLKGRRSSGLRKRTAIAQYWWKDHGWSWGIMHLHWNLGIWQHTASMTAHFSWKV